MNAGTICRDGKIRLCAARLSVLGGDMAGRQESALADIGVRMNRTVNEKTEWRERERLEKLDVKHC